MTDPIEIFVGAGKDLTLTIPTMNRNQLIEIIGDFLGRDYKDPTRNLKQLLNSAGEITLVVTTKRGTQK